MPTTVSGVKNNIWRKQQSGLYAPSRMNFPLDSLAAYFPLWEPSQSSLLNGTGIATGAPMVLVGPGAQTITVTQAGTFLIYLPKGATGTATTGTMAVTGSPVALVGGLNTITTTGAVGNFTVAVPTIISKDPNAHVGTIVGATWGSQGRTFDGINDKITIPHAASIDIALEDFSVGVWANVTDVTNYRQLIYKRQDYDPATYYRGYGLRLDQTTGYFDCIIDSRPSPAAYTIVADTTNHVNTGYHLYFLTVDRDSATGMKLWVDAVEVASGDPTAVGTLTNTLSLLVGIAGSGGFPFKGGMGELLMYKGQALTAAEIAHYYQATKWRYS